MNNIIGHVVGLDEIHKKKLAKQIQDIIRVVDLDMYQQLIYNGDDITKNKKIWNQLSKDIVFHKKQKKLIGSKQIKAMKRIKAMNLDRKIKKLFMKRRLINTTIHEIWKNQMTDEINKELTVEDPRHILFVGLNIFPKDYRLKINIPMKDITVNLDGKNYFNKIMADIKSNYYASNQIKYYLNIHADKIIRGAFPLNLLKINYLSDKYEKCTNYYYKHGYQFIDIDKLSNAVQQLHSQLSAIDKLVDRNDNVYIATLYKSGDTIPVNVQKPLQGYTTKVAALDAIRSKMKQNAPVYLYKVKANQFNMIDDKLLAMQEINPTYDESIMLTI